MTRHTEEEISSQFFKKYRAEKHVTFPPDEEIVSGFAESKETLKDVESLTLTEVILAYQRSCAKHQVEPNSKTLAQLKECIFDGDRANSLDLRGERLDYCACESLEEILKSLKFDFINLQGAELEENGASSLMDMILYYESAVHLDVSSNPNMGVSGWQALARLIQQSASLWSLDASNMPVVEYPAQVLSKALLTSRLTVLHLANTCLSGKPLFTLVVALKKNATLEELCLANNELNSYQDSMQLGELLKYNSTLRLLDLSNNTISDSGLEEICDALKVQQRGLRTLLLWNNQITHIGMIHLENALPFVTTLETLNLGKNKLQSVGIHMLKEPLMVNRSILQLGLANTDMSCEGAVALAEFLAESPQIQRLDLSQNQVLTAGLMALALALRINHSLVRLDLDKNPTEEQEEFLIETQKTLLCRISDLCIRNTTATK